jgi:hypothetical protein
LRFLVARIRGALSYLLIAPDQTITIQNIRWPVTLWSSLVKWPASSSAHPKALLPLVPLVC